MFLSLPAYEVRMDILETNFSEFLTFLSSHYTTWDEKQFLGIFAQHSMIHSWTFEELLDHHLRIHFFEEYKEKLHLFISEVEK